MLENFFQLWTSVGAIDAAAVALAITQRDVSVDLIEQPLMGLGVAER
jgi:hypothetical protein